MKDSKIFARSTIVGAVTNLVLNLIFTPVVGPLGSAIATTVSYVQVWGIRLWHSKKYIHFKINLKRDVVTYVALIFQAIIFLYVKNSIILGFMELSLFVFVFILYFGDMYYLMTKVISKK